ncbi:hypothetical protein ACOXXX_02410 [Thalassococcus sp. BH17M4-6]|uniref:hypothetical protein n=1 Tax=Thalassococcus sp. BH17M4-6 TaxID=3413148 RepID=UPI003BCDF13B
MFIRAVSVLTAVSLALPVRAAPADDLADALGVPEMVQIMRIEGLDYGAELGRDLLPGGGGPGWQDIVAEIYDTDAMEATVKAGFAEALSGTDITPLLAFFEDGAGARIVELEIAAREAMVEDEVEQAARDTYLALEGRDDARLAALETFVDQNDLIEANVVGALNASFMFYKGLAEGGGLEMTEAEMLSDVWTQEDDTRADTREWLFAYLLLAYGPLDDDALAEYSELSDTPAGQAMNRALFQGFNDMYDEISYALGLAAAQQMQGEDL